MTDHLLAPSDRAAIHAYKAKILEAFGTPEQMLEDAENKILALLDAAAAIASYTTPAGARPMTERTFAENARSVYAARTAPRVTSS